MKDKKIKNIQGKQNLISFQEQERSYSYPDNSDLIDKAYNLIENSDYEEAFNIFTSILNRSENDPDILNGIGICLCELGYLSGAEHILLKAIDEYPDDEITISNLAGVYWEMNDLTRALFYYNKSFEIDRENLDTRLNLINLYLDSDIPFMALALCSETYKKFPENAETINLFNEIVLNLGLSII